jgi:hypothetical protein
MLDTQAIHQIPTDHERVYAFRIEGGVGAEEMDGLAGTMNEAFDRHDEPVRMLLILEGFRPEDATTGLTLESLRAQLRSATGIERYAVVGAPDAARRMIEASDAVSPIDARTFDREEEDAAWAFVEARPTD